MRWCYGLCYLLAASPLQTEYEYAGQGHNIDVDGNSDIDSTSAWFSANNSSSSYFA